MEFSYRFSPLRIPFPICLIAPGRLRLLAFPQANEAKEAEHSAIAPALRLRQPAVLGLGTGQQHSLCALQALCSNNCRQPAALACNALCAFAQLNGGGRNTAPSPAPGWYSQR